MELLNNGKLNYIIYLFTTYEEALTGGLMAMHKLAHKLAALDNNVYIFCDAEYPHENIHRIPSSSYGSWGYFTYNYVNTISIYPQIIAGNPFNTKHVVRWVLYHVEDEIAKTWSDGDKIYNFNNFSTSNEFGKLTIFDYNTDKLYPMNNERKGFCHILHKNTPEDVNILKYLNSEDLGGWKTMGDYNYLREKFNKHEYMLTYDRHSFLTVAAVLCGCKAIILNVDDDLLPEEYRLLNPIQKYGVAYGIDDIAWANNTIDLVREHIIKLEDLDHKTVIEFDNYFKRIC